MRGQRPNPAIDGALLHLQHNKPFNFDQKLWSMFRKIKKSFNIKVEHINFVCSYCNGADF